MSNEDKKLVEKILKFLEFAKKECPECYQKMQQCCADTENKNRE